MARILVADDEDGFREFLVDALELACHEVTPARDGQDALERLRRHSFHVLVTDLTMPRLDGLSLLKKVREEQPELEVLVLTAHGSVESAVEAMRLGAFDYLQKPLDSPDALRLLVDRAAQHRALRDSAQRETPDEPRLSWGAPAMNPVLDGLRKVARTDATVLLLGESGVGKEVAARTLHAWSNRAPGPFMAVNCAAFSESLLESELFGHEKGSFTGAVQQRRGKLELADGGTFFLDEVGELKPELQARLLRVLQEKRFERLGGARLLSTDVRWVAATNRDLQAMVREGSFREDLYHRLAVFPVRIPPLRERVVDIEPLAQHLLRKIGRELGRPDLKMDSTFLSAITRARWSGNVRELANTLERAVILAEGSGLHAGLLPQEVLGDPAEQSAQPSARTTSTPSVSVRATPAPASGVAQGSSVAQASSSGPLKTLEALEQDAIKQALEQLGGNRKQAADALGIGLRTLYDKLKRYGLG